MRNYEACLASWYPGRETRLSMRHRIYGRFGLGLPTEDLEGFEPQEVKTSREMHWESRPELEWDPRVKPWRTRRELDGD